jgi:8-oxo-dGTP pyrophosphatase MutT (NUDIX family)
MSFTKYVCMVVFDPTLTYVIGITKKKGPSFLLNKLTFPGGKVEDGESVLEAARREMREETGLDIPLSAWRQVHVLTAEDRECTTFAAVSDKFFNARTCETEPVWQLQVNSHRGYASNQPAQYAPDFLELLDKSEAPFLLPKAA